MKAVKLLAVFGLVAMTIALGQGFIVGDFWHDGALLLQNPWGIVSVVDLYVGFILFSFWIGFREKKRLHATLWIIAMMILGFHAASLYILLTAVRCRGDWLDFFLGGRKIDIL